MFDRKVLRTFEPGISNFFQKIYHYFLAIVFLLPLFIPSNKPKSRIYTLLLKGKTTSQFLTNFSEPYTTYMEIFKISSSSKNSNYFSNALFFLVLLHLHKVSHYFIFLSPFLPNIAECSIPHCPHIKFCLALLLGRENNFHLFLFCTITKSFFQTQNWLIKL